MTGGPRTECLPGIHDVQLRHMWGYGQEIGGDDLQVHLL